jgi:hypothetical protein
MKRDMDLIRELLLKLESVPSEMGDVFSFSPEDKEVSVEGYTPAQIEYPSVAAKGDRIHRRSGLTAHARYYVQRADVGGT